MTFTCTKFENVTYGAKALAQAKADMARVDQFYRKMMEANAAQPYNHDEYNRFSALQHAAMMILVDGDENYAEALIEAQGESGEEIMYYLVKYNRYDFEQCIDRDRELPEFIDR